MYSLGSRLKETRIRRNLTQKMLADRVNKSVSAISSYELDAQLPPLDVLISIASVLHVSLDYLAGLEKEETYSTKNLTPEQRDLVAAVFKEFSCTAESGYQLSAEKLTLLRGIIQLVLRSS